MDKYLKIGNKKLKTAHKDELDKEKAEENQDKPLSFTLKEVKGDLFSCPPTESLAHCISADCRLGKGIAAIFKKKFGGIQELKDQKKNVGEVAILKRDQRTIFYLITKKAYWQKPTYDDLKLSLTAMLNYSKTNNITQISMPKIGCGLDGLKWLSVLDIIKQVFENSDIKITVYVL